MTIVPRTFRWFSYRTVVVLVLVAGIASSLVSYRLGRKAELRRAEVEFVQRAKLRHALTHEILGHFEDALFGLSALFVASHSVTLAEFRDATERLAGRLAGVHAFEWVPNLAHAERAAFEEAVARDYARPFEVIEIAPDGSRRRAPDRPHYYPIAYVQPLRGNEAALGYDLMSGATRDFLERARTSREMIVTHPVRLVQEAEGKSGIVMIAPVFRSVAPGPVGKAGEGPDVFCGFLQCVFRVHDLLETTHSREPDEALDMLFVDAAEKDPAKRILYHRPADDEEPRTPVGEHEYHAGLHREMPLRFGERDWRVIFRPRAGWIEGYATRMPLLRSGGILLLSALLAGLVRIVGRRTETIRHEVIERTSELTESRRQIATVLHALPGMAYRCTYEEHLVVLFLSEGAQALTGWTVEELIGGTPPFRDCIHPDDLPRVREVTRAAIQDQSDVEVEYRIRTRAGAEKWVLARGRGVVPPGDGIPFFEGLAIDITAQKNAEAARLSLERKLLEGQKLESLGLLAGGIAHDFNNLLSSILGNASVARLHVPAQSEADAPLRAIETASLRAAELCRQMLAYAGKGRFVIEPTDLTALVEDLVPLLKISVSAQGTLRLELARRIPPVSADATQVRQIVMNLVLNAADAIAGRRGQITISTGVMHADAALLASCVAGAGLPAGDYVFLEVRDTGTGMTPDVVAKIFDPFFTTKFAGRGLGLAAALGIMRGHNGALQVQSTPGVGTSFRLLLPPTAGVAPARAAESPGSGPWRKDATVLIIEDEEPVRAVTAEILKSFGIAPLLAADGPAGVEMFRRDPSKIDLVLLDLLMPGMGGEDVLRELRAIQPDVRVLLMSGYSEGDILGRLGRPDGRLAFIPKPFTRAALERKLREILA